MTLLNLADLGVSSEITVKFERRIEPRSVSWDEAIMLVATPIDRRQTVRVLDISKCGMRILTSKRLGHGETLQLRLSATLIMGIVRSCKLVAGGFSIGVEFINVYVSPDCNPNIPL